MISKWFSQIDSKGSFVVLETIVIFHFLYKYFISVEK